MIFKEEALWTEKYRPRTIEDTILPEAYKKMFSKYVEIRNIPNLLLSGGPGVGKTTIAKAMCDELGCDYIVINGSLDAGINTIRSDVANFASAIAFNGIRKVVIFDEADNMSLNVQRALRNFIDEFSTNCAFIFTCNYKARIIEPLQSRLSPIDFVFGPNDRPKMAAQFFKRVLKILDKEKIEYDKKTVAMLTEKFFPDFRRVLGELQKFSALGKIDEGIFANIKQISMSVLFDFLKNKDFNGMRKWVAENSDQDYHSTYREIYNFSSERVQQKSMPGFIVTLAEYMDKHTRAIDPEITLAAFLTEVMIEAMYKE